MTTENRAHGAPRDYFAGGPTGFRRLTPNLLRVDRAAESFAGLPNGVSAPSQLLAAFKAAAPRLGLSARLVHAVDWLFRFTQPQDWDKTSRPILWPSAAMQQEALGLSSSQVKAINRQLIEAGLLTMKDSPNGKRYGARDAKGRIVEGYGFDLTPIAVRHAEFVRLAEEAKVERDTLRRLRRRATIARKGITQILETAAEYGFEGAEWVTLARDTAAIAKALKTADRPDEAELGVRSLERRQTEGKERLEGLLKTVEITPVGPENQPHNTTTNESLNPKDTVIDSQRCKGDWGGTVSPTQESQRREAEKREQEPVLRLRPEELIRLAPRLRPFLPSADPNWREIVEAAEWLRHELDISKALWGDACQTLGREMAAIALAIVSAKDPEHFKTTAGGYFRGMVAKHRTGELNLDRSIWALRRPMAGSGGPKSGRGGTSQRANYQD